MVQVCDEVRARLLAAVGDVAADPEACARSPGRDFTRNRKIGLFGLLWTIVTMGADTLRMELLRSSGLSAGAPTAGALCQQWAKLNDAAMPRLHARFLSMFDPVPTMGRFWLLACDGTELALAPDASDAETRMPPARGPHGRNSCHLTCAFDVARGVFCDMVCQGGRSQDEPGAACELAARCRPPAGLEALWVLDRGFWSLNLAWRMRASGAHFVCRVKEADFEALLRCGLRGLPPAGCGSLDAGVDVCATRTRSPAGRSRPREPWLYRVVRGRFGGLPPEGPGECWLRLRLVRVRAPGGWLCLATDLPAPGLPPSALAALYRERWREETAFAELKHTIGLERPHVRTLARVAQECWGRLTLHAACALSAASVPEPPPGPRNRRATDRACALKLAAAAMRGAAVDLARACARLTQAVRPGRSFRRRKRPPAPPSFSNRH
ncbi:MAG: transposase [Coriobacteriales bacterium]|nr:transposase [Coriobacteriales bacterium]